MTGTRRGKKSLATLVLSAYLSACTSGGLASDIRLGSDPDGGSQLLLDSAAYGSDYFQFNKPMKIRPANDLVFYFKHCDLIGRRPFYLQNEYGCTPPP